MTVPRLPTYIQTWNKQLNGALFASRVATVSLGMLGMMGAMLSITRNLWNGCVLGQQAATGVGIRIALGRQRKEMLQAALGRAFKLHP
jgi:hypothetical protein